MEYINIDKLDPHPKNKKIYKERNNEQLKQRIKEHGFKESHPIIISSDKKIISGHRRWSVAKQLGIKKVPVIKKEYDSDSQEALLELLTSNQYREKTPGEKIKEAEQWEKIEKQKAKKRKVKGGEISQEDSINLDEPDKGRTDEKVAEKVGISKDTYRKGKKVKEKAEQGDNKAQEQWEKLEKGETSFHKAKKEVEENKGKQNNKKENVHFKSNRNDWETPNHFFERLDREFNFDIDVCATKETAKCENYYTENENGLNQKWEKTCWMNPPYGGEIKKWIKKAYKESKNQATVVCLIPSRTDTKYWHEYVMKANEIRFVKGRIKFDGQENSAPFPSAVVIFKNPNQKTPVLGDPIDNR